jgi:putative lipoic acid-binding regulatory protein
LKVIGRNVDNFQDFVLSIISKHVEESDIHSVHSRTSRADSYLSVTVTFTAYSREHYDAIWNELSTHERILMLI